MRHLDYLTYPHHVLLYDEGGWTADTTEEWTPAVLTRNQVLTVHAFRFTVSSTDIVMVHFVIAKYTFNGLTWMEYVCNMSGVFGTFELNEVL